MFRVLKSRREVGAFIGATALALGMGACTPNNNATTDAVVTEVDTAVVEEGGAAAPAPEGGAAEAPAAVPAGDFPRNETVFTSGQAWGPPSSWNPIPGQFGATFLSGGCYEQLFQLDPNTLHLVPWLAESGDWDDDNTYTVHLRPGLTWDDGEPLTADDVVFTIDDVGQRPGVAWGVNLWEQLESVERVDDTTVTFHFTDPRPQEWENFLYTRTIVPQHVMADWSDDALMTGPNENPVCSGALSYNSHSDDRMVWERNDNWWGIDAMNMHLPMRYVVDIVNPSNEVALGMLQQGQLDWSNNFLPGITQLVDDGTVTTYYPESPFMIAGNTAVLVPNSQRPPLNDVNFRQALARAIDVNEIALVAYGGIVSPASPTGLMPQFEQFYDQAAIDQYGWTFDIAQAQQILADNGYVDVNGDGFVENPDGSEINLSLQVPSGWTDWMDAARIIADSAGQAGIHITVQTPDSGQVDANRENGEFDLMLNNWSQVSNTPWQHYNYVCQMPIQDRQLIGNFGRFDTQECFTLTEELARTRTDDPRFQEIMSQLQAMTMQDMTMIPLWYNGAWTQFTNGTWTGWPGPGDPYPVTWGGWIQLGAIDTLANLHPAG